MFDSNKLIKGHFEELAFVAMYCVIGKHIVLPMDIPKEI